MFRMSEERRLNRLLKYQLEIAEKRYAARIGKVMEILVEGEAKNQKMAAARETWPRLDGKHEL